ncbi:MAG TPA: serine--tRNA ligase [Pyrinomonadaceae bacterium]|jgi:seryl-tRNA synthetase|nr:serine--tRNA ligase [Pyrinomonadaceae bacterium]
MLDLNFVRDHLEKVRTALEARGFPTDALETFAQADAERRRIIGESDRLNAERNASSREIGALMKAGKADEAEARRRVVGQLKESIAELDGARDEAEARMTELLSTLPNIPHESVPVGADESFNREERRWGAPPSFDFEPRDHVDLGAALGILDLERAAKLAAARFAILSGAGAQLERALVNFMLDLHTREHGYTETLPPFIVNAAALFGTGQLPKFEGDLFKLVDERNLYLIPTAEVPVTNIHREEILDASVLPLKKVAYTPCFRSEAGSYGRDTRGVIRQHQFEKVELVKLALPENSYDELESLTRNAERVLQRLGLAYRVVTLATGDIGFGAAKTYDIEVWLPSQNTYREISSCSNYEAFQARRAQIRFRRAGGAKPEYVHTLNGSGLAVGRTWIAILENYQQADGSVLIPEALRPYMNGLEKIEADER